jgi:hypothetical protein
MTIMETILQTLKAYGIEILSVNGNQIRLGHNYEVEVESNGMFKLIDDGYIVAPFDDPDELCRFILT